MNMQNHLAHHVISTKQRCALFMDIGPSLLYGPHFRHFHLPPPFEVIFYDNAFTYSLQPWPRLYYKPCMGQNTQYQNALL